MENLKKRDKRKILLVLPALILPFLALAFYAMGGGRASQPATAKNTGINTALPDASFSKEKPTDKLGIYQLGDQDSVKSESNGLDQVAHRLGFNAIPETDPTREIDLKLQAIQQQINVPTETKAPISSKGRTVQVPGMKSDVERLEQLMSTMQSAGGEDQEMKQLSGMLEKVLDIQHPERVRDAYIRQVNSAPEERFAAIPAQTLEKQTLVQGSVLKLILTDSVTIGEVKLSKGQLLFGLCNLTNQRLLVDIKTIRIDNNIVPVDLSIYSLDGIKGIAAPDAILNSAISGGADDAVQSLQLLTMDQSIGAQAAGAGIDAAKSLFSKKVRRAKMKIKAGIPVLLRNNQTPK